jgi:hypothetical protein
MINKRNATTIHDSGSCAYCHPLPVSRQMAQRAEVHLDPEVLVRSRHNILRRLSGRTLCVMLAGHSSCFKSEWRGGHPDIELATSPSQLKSSSESCGGTRGQERIHIESRRKTVGSYFLGYRDSRFVGCEESWTEQSEVGLASVRTLLALEGRPCFRFRYDTGRVGSLPTVETDDRFVKFQSISQYLHAATLDI